jgi:hypothetical protein
MKMFRPIRDKGQLRAICAAMNKLFWKTPSDGTSADEMAEYWVGELLDRDIDIAWNRKAQRFQLRRSNNGVTGMTTEGRT